MFRTYINSNGTPDIKGMEKRLIGLYRRLESRQSRAARISAVKDIYDEQRQDGSFGMIDPASAPADARVQFYFLPTYLCTAIMMRGEVDFCRDENFLQKLQKAMKVCTLREFAGHGYEAEEHRQEVIRIFRLADCSGFLSRHPDLCPEFTTLWNRMDAELIFTYGTLMRGRRNHRFMDGCEYLGEGVIKGYALYDLGSFPGIRYADQDHTVRGEIYRVPRNKLPALDELEGEGSLYKRMEVTVQEAGSFATYPAQVYEYLHDVDPEKEIPASRQPYGSGGEKLVWYVAYGSNMLFERFRYYVQGGHCPLNGKDYDGCADKRLPTRSIRTEIPYELYFGNKSSTWKGYGVAFIDTEKPGNTPARAYLVTEKQLDDIRRQEGSSPCWYGNRFRLQDIDGIPAYTLTAKGRNTENAPSEEYMEIIRQGRLETEKL